MSNCKLVIVRTDGLYYESVFTGWDAETAMISLFSSKASDPRTLAAFWFDGQAPTDTCPDWRWEECRTYIAEDLLPKPKLGKVNAL
jgi:hypothetical protein